MTYTTYFQGTLAEALVSSDIDSGDRVLLSNGVYHGDLTTTLQGVTILPKSFDTPIIDGSFLVKGENLTIEIIELYDADFTNRTSVYTGSSPSDIPVRDGLKSDVGSVKFVGCVIHDCRQGMLITANANVEITDCVIFYNGWSAPDRGHGHGIYASGETLTIKNCIIFDMFSYGIHCYGQGASVLLKDITVENCIVFGAGSLENNAMSNILIGGTSSCHADNAVVKNCCTYHRGESGQGVLIGFGAYGSNGGVIQDNIIVGGSTSLEFRGWQDETKVVTGNWFGAPAAGVDPAVFTDNVYSSGVPDAVKVYPSDYTTTLAYVAIFNGSQADSVEVDLSSVTGLSVGDSVTVANVQDLFVDIVTLTLDEDKCISVDMRAVSHTVATPQGWTAPATTFPLFGAFVVQKTLLS